MKRETRQTLLLATLLIVLFGILKHGSRVVSGAADFGFMAAMLFQLYIPLWMIRKEGSSLRDYNINSYGLLEFNGAVDWQSMWLDLRRVLILCALTFPPFWVAYHALQSILGSQHGYQVYCSFTIPNAFPNLILTSFLLVALPEEIFYRGFVQTRLLRAWPNQKFILGIPVGVAIIVTSAFFAMGHFIGEYHLGRLTPFFPAFLFSFLVFRSNSIFGAVVFHALCNIFAQLLQSSYFWK